MPGMSAKFKFCRRWLAVAAVVFAVAAPAASEAQVVVVANGSPITELDIAQRSKLIASSTRKTPPRQAVIQELIDDRLKISKAKYYGPDVSDAEVEETVNEPEPAAASGGREFAADEFPIEDYDELLVSEILPLLAELDVEELEVVREREQSGKARATLLRRIEQLAEGEVEGEPTVATPAFAARGSAVEEGDELVDGEDELLFPIEDYDDLRVSEILPLLPELYDDELELVAERERDGSNRASILNRIDDLLGGEPEPAPAPAPKKAAPKKAAPKKAAVRKTAAKKAAPVRKLTPSKKAAPAKKAAAKKAAPVKKAATATKKTAAKKKAATKKAAARKR